jgi:serine/threonine-protein kinase RsbW
MAPATSVKMSLASEIRLVDLVHEASQRMAEIAGFEEDDALNVALAVREAVINAITHGNGGDPSRRVDVTLATNGAGIRVTVRDHGAGFDPGETRDPTAGDNLLHSSGRGLLLIRAFVDEVKFRNLKGRGMEITLVKTLRPRPTSVGRRD